MVTVSNRGKFSERLKNILRFKKKKSINFNIDKFEDSNVIYFNFIKIIAAIPSLVYNNISDNNTEKRTDDNNTIINNYKSINNDSVHINNDIQNVRAENKKKIEQINIEEIKNKQYNYLKNIHNLENKDEKNKVNIGLNEEENKSTFISYLHVNNKLKSKNEIKQLEKSENDVKQLEKSENDVKQLEKSILNIIKKNLISIVNKMEILQSELYILSEVNGESKVLKECQKELDHIKSILCKIDKLKERYDFLKDNYDFEYLLEIGDNNLVDKIIELKDTFGNNEAIAVTEDYKLLDVYKFLYLKIDDLKEKTVLFEDKKKEEEAKLKDRDIDFEKLKNEVYDVEYGNRNYDIFVRNQNDLLESIANNVSKINSYEEVNYRLKGFNELFKNTFKYFGLLMVNPLKGIIPSIATQTLITGNIIKNLYNNLEWEENRRMVYEAIDYSSMISNAITDLDNTSRIVDMTLEDIVHLKMKYNEKFKQYQGDFLEYKDIMHKISDMENKILGNKIKIEIMKKKALDQKMANEKKLMLVRELNENRNE